MPRYRFWIFRQMPRVRNGAESPRKGRNGGSFARASRLHGKLGRDLLCRLASFDYEGHRGCHKILAKSGLFTWPRRWL
jgi:hypothetical protein